ncbi:MAG TPA: AI-2E family transporter [Myxococcaceae bacterium]|nr:AI-2E family transporter [Myxococcaceae bacterium]
MFLRPAVRSFAAMAQDFRLQVSPRTIWIAGLHILGVAIVWRSVYRVGAVVGLIGLALLFALALEPALRKLKSFGVPRGLGVALVVAASAAILALLLGTLIPMLVVQLQSLLTALPGLVQRLLETRWVQELAIDQQLEAQLLSELPHRVTELVKPALDVVQGAVALVGAAVVLGFLVIFMLLFGPPLYAQLIGWVPADRRDTLADGLERVLKVVSGYLGGSLLVALIGTIVIGTVLALMGVPYFVPLALSYLVLGLIPWIGSALSATMVSLTTFAAMGWQKAVIVLVFFLIYQQLEGQLLQPLVQRQTLQMNPLLISLVLLLGGAMGGLIGVVLALPAVAAAQALLEVYSNRNGRSSRKGGTGEGLLLTGPIRSDRTPRAET